MTVDALMQQWLEDGVELRPPASSEAIRSIERLLGRPLPDDLRAFYEKADGMRDFDHDRWFVSVWSSERLLAEHERVQRSDDRGVFTNISFADAMISSWYFWFRIRDDGSLSIFVELAGQEFASFSSFLSTYLDAPESLGLISVTPPRKLKACRRSRLARAK